MPVQKPEDWSAAFEACINAGHVDAALALYEPGSVLVAPGSYLGESGEGYVRKGRP